MLDTSVAVVGGGGLPSRKQVGYEIFHVPPGNSIDLAGHALGLEELLEQVQRFQVSFDGSGTFVLGHQTPEV